jgi:cytochrome c biogenesis protein CcdA
VSDLHPFTLIEQLWWAGPLAGVAVGVVLGASPLAWPILATAVGVRAGASDGETGRSSRVLLVLGAGITLVYAGLGLLTGQLERVISEVLGAWAGVGYVVLAVTVAAGGLFLLVRPNATCRTLVRPPRGGPAAFLVGIALGVVNCPACAGIITGVAVSAAALGSTAYSVLVMVALGVGHTLTLLVVSRLSVNVVREAARSVTAIQRTGGVLLLLSAAFFVFQAQAGGTSISPTLP